MQYWKIKLMYNAGTDTAISHTKISRVKSWLQLFVPAPGSFHRWFCLLGHISPLLKPHLPPCPPHGEKKLGEQITSTEDKLSLTFVPGSFHQWFCLLGSISPYYGKNWGVHNIYSRQVVVQFGDVFVISAPYL